MTLTLTQMILQTQHLIAAQVCGPFSVCFVGFLDGYFCSCDRTGHRMLYVCTMMLHFFMFDKMLIFFSPGI